MNRLFLVKKLTVSGTIGKIQGMMKAAKPPNSPAIKIPHRDCFPASAVVASAIGAVALLSCETESIGSLSEKTKSSGTAISSSSLPSGEVLSENSIPSVDIKLSCVEAAIPKKGIAIICIKRKY